MKKGINKEVQHAQVTWLEEVRDQEFDDDVFGACTTNTFSLSDYWGNKGNWCTATHECMLCFASKKFIKMQRKV